MPPQFMAILPAGSVTRRDGVLDIAAHQPAAANPPDLGPKGYFSQTSDDRPGGTGSTKLHSAFKRCFFFFMLSTNLCDRPQWYVSFDLCC